MLAEQLVEQIVLCRRMVVAEPPEPVASFGDVQFLPGPRQSVRLRLALSLRGEQELARLVEQVPGGVVFVVADPDGEIVRYPTAREKSPDAVGGRVVAQVITHTGGADDGMPCRTAIERPQEFDAAVRVILPAVFAVKNDGDECGTSRVVRFDGTADRLDSPQQVVGRPRRVAPLIMEPDQVAQAMVAKYDL